MIIIPKYARGKSKDWDDKSIHRWPSPFSAADLYVVRRPHLQLPSERDLCHISHIVHLGMARLDGGDVSGARSALIEALELARDLDHHDRMWASLQRDTHPAAAMAWSFEALAALAVATANHEIGALLFGAAKGVRRSIGMATWAFDRHMHERTEQALRAALGDDAFAAKVSEGMGVSLEGVLKLAATLENPPR